LAQQLRAFWVKFDVLVKKNEKTLAPLQKRTLTGKTHEDTNGNYNKREECRSPVARTTSAGQL